MEHEHASNRPNLGLALLAKRFVHMLTTGGVKAGARHVKLEQTRRIITVHDCMHATVFVECIADINVVAGEAERSIIITCSILNTCATPF